MPRGGVRPGSGRPSKADEDKICNIATNSIVSKYGSLEAGFEALLASKEPSLIKFVWEHAVGKPKDKIESTVEHSGSIALIEIIDKAEQVASGADLQEES